MDKEKFIIKYNKKYIGNDDNNINNKYFYYFKINYNNFHLFLKHNFNKYDNIIINSKFNYKELDNRIYDEYEVYNLIKRIYFKNKEIYINNDFILKFYNILKFFNIIYCQKIIINFNINYIKKYIYNFDLLLSLNAHTIILETNYKFYIIHCKNLIMNYNNDINNNNNNELIIKQITCQNLIIKNINNFKCNDFLIVYDIFIFNNNLLCNNNINELNLKNNNFYCLNEFVKYFNIKILNFYFNIHNVNLNNFNNIKKIKLDYNQKILNLQNNIINNKITIDNKFNNMPDINLNGYKIKNLQINYFQNNLYFNYLIDYLLSNNGVDNLIIKFNINSRINNNIILDFKYYHLNKLIIINKTVYNITLINDVNINKKFIQIK